MFFRSLFEELYSVMDNPLRVSNYKKQFRKIKMAGFDFANGIRITNIPEFERSNLSSKSSVYEVVKNKILVPLSKFKNNEDARCIQVLV